MADPQICGRQGPVINFGACGGVRVGARLHRPFKTQDPKTLKPHKSPGAIPATPKKQTRACWVCSVSVLRRREDEPTGGHLTEDDAREAAHRTTRARDPPLPLSEATPRSPRRRRSACRPKILISERSQTAHSATWQARLPSRPGTWKCPSQAHVAGARARRAAPGSRDRAVKREARA